MKVLFMTNVPSPYRVDFFNELGKYCDLTVVFEKRTSNERDESWKNYQFNTFKGFFLRGISVSTDTAFCFGINKIIKEGKFDKIICANFSSPTGIRAISYMRRKKIPYYLESDGGMAKSGKGVKEAIKTYFIKGAIGYFSTGKQHDTYYLTYGAKKAQLIRYPFTSLKKADIDSEVISFQSKKNIREKLNIKEDKVIISVGRFSYLNGYGKGYDVLLKAASELGESFGWYIIGGEPTEEFAKMAEGLDNVHFVDFLGKDDLKGYYHAADLFVLMSVGEAWGLVINEAMAKGLPIVTTNKCVAGLELVDESNGAIINVGDDKELIRKIKMFFENETLREAMSKNSLYKIGEYTIENMAKIHFEYLKETSNEVVD